MKKGRKKIIVALLSLLEKKSLEEINVTELCRVAHISRSTFYAYYTNINQCLDDIEEIFLMHINKDIMKSGESSDWDEFFQNVNHMLDYMKKNGEIYSVLYRNSPTFLSRMVEEGQKMFDNQNLEHRYRKEDSFQKKFFASYYIYGMAGAILYWIESGEEAESEQITDYLHTMIQGN